MSRIESRAARRDRGEISRQIVARPIELDGSDGASRRSARRRGDWRPEQIGPAGSVKIGSEVAQEYDVVRECPAIRLARIRIDRIGPPPSRLARDILRFAAKETTIATRQCLTLVVAAGNHDVAAIAQAHSGNGR